MTTTDLAADLAEALRDVLLELEEQAGEQGQPFPDQGQQCARYVLESEAAIRARRLLHRWEWR